MSAQANLYYSLSLLSIIQNLSIQYHKLAKKSILLYTIKNCVFYSEDNQLLGGGFIT